MLVCRWNILVQLLPCLGSRGRGICECQVVGHLVSQCMLIVVGLVL